MAIGFWVARTRLSLQEELPVLKVRKVIQARKGLKVTRVQEELPVQREGQVRRGPRAFKALREILVPRELKVQPGHRALPDLKVRQGLKGLTG